MRSASGLEVGDQKLSRLELAARGLRMAWCVIRHIVPKSMLKVQSGAIRAGDGDGQAWSWHDDTPHQKKYHKLAEHWYSYIVDFRFSMFNQFQFQKCFKFRNRIKPVISGRIPLAKTFSYDAKCSLKLFQK